MIIIKSIMKALMAVAFTATLALGPGLAAEPAALDAVLIKLAPPPSGEALPKIPDLGRKLLALRSYLRYGPKIAERWSWTDADIKAFQGSPEQKRLLADIAAVNRAFHGGQSGLRSFMCTPPCAASMNRSPSGTRTSQWG